MRKIILWLLTALLFLTMLMGWGLVTMMIRTSVAL
jgi:hypothetical protein